MVEFNNDDWSYFEFPSVLYTVGFLTGRASGLWNTFFSYPDPERFPLRKKLTKKTKRGLLKVAKHRWGEP